jgi:hypothetical protein
LAPSVSHAQARTWAFAKDTVYEWKAGGDSVAYTNSGTDTLKFDAVSIDIISPASVRIACWFEANENSAQNANSIWVNTDEGSRIYGRVELLTLAPTKTRSLHHFTIEDHRNIVAKRAAIAVGDTLLTRLVFSAAGGRGRDTLFVRGVQEWPTGLRTFKPGSGAALKDGTPHDLRGRRLEKIPQGVRVPFRATVTK